jgi:acetolactate synthase-1/3 small subunit
MSAQHTVTALVQNETGTINRLVSMFRRRGLSIACFNAGDCEQEGFSRITLLLDGDEAALAQCLRQLEKLIDVVEVEDLSPKESVARELALIRVKPAVDDRRSLARVVADFQARIPRPLEAELVVEAVAEVSTIERLISALRPYNVKEIVRTGTVAIRTAAEA